MDEADETPWSVVGGKVHYTYRTQHELETLRVNGFSAHPKEDNVMVSKGRDIEGDKYCARTIANGGIG